MWRLDRQKNYNPGIRTQGNLDVSIVLLFMKCKCMDLDWIIIEIVNKSNCSYQFQALIGSYGINLISRSNI